MNPSKISFTKTESGQYDLQSQEDDNVSFSDVVNGIGALGCVILTIVCWSNNNYFDNPLGKLAFLPVLFFAGMFGYYTTAFFFYTFLVITTFGCLVGWVFDFSFLNSMFAFFSNLF